MEVYASNFSYIDIQGDVTFSGGAVSDRFTFGRSANLLICDYTFCQEAQHDFVKLFDPTFGGSCSIQGGTFYFDISRFLDTDKYKATQTKDAACADIWVVTEK